MADNYLQPHRRVKWMSKYLDGFWFKGTIVRVIGDRAIVRGDKDNKLLVLPVYRIIGA